MTRQPNGPTAIEAQLTKVISTLPGVTTLKKLGHVSFLIGKKVLAFTKADAIVLKLPADRIAELSSSGKAGAFVMGKRTMKEWAVIKYEKPSEVRKDIPIFKEARSFVGDG